MVAVPGHLADETWAWLLSGDAAVRFQTWRDLLGSERPELQRSIASDGDAATILAAHAAPGWGRGFYQPKWTCPHYALLELRDLAVSRDHPVCGVEVATALARDKGDDGGFNPADSVKESDVCMNAGLGQALTVLPPTTAVASKQSRPSDDRLVVGFDQALDRKAPPSWRCADRWFPDPWSHGGAEMRSAASGGVGRGPRPRSARCAR